MPENDPNKSPLVDDWTDEKYRDRYVFHARENYELAKQLRIGAQQGHVEYGKWLIASMLAIHGGSIYAISGLRRDSPAIANAVPLINAVAFQVAGIACIMLAGFLAWLNFQFAERVYFNRINPGTLYRNDIKGNDERPTLVNATLYGAALFGILSYACFLVSAWLVFRVLRGNP